MLSFLVALRIYHELSWSIFGDPGVVSPVGRKKRGGSKGAVFEDPTDSL